jgi:hypothetical protein
MKQFIVIFFLGVALASCNNAETTSTATGADSTGAAVITPTEVKLPIPLEKPYRNWQIGSTENVVAAMNALKAFVDKDFTALAAATGDSLELDFDYLRTKLSRDSAMKMFTAMRPQYNDLKVTMYDYVSVISGDKKDEWVTFWYKQSWKNEKGVADSMNVTNDVKMKDGKMIELDEKTSHFPKK